MRKNLNWFLKFECLFFSFIDMQMSGCAWLSGCCLMPIQQFFQLYRGENKLIISPKRSLGDILCLLRFLLLLHHPDCCRVMYCYSTFLFHYYTSSSSYYYYYYSSTHVWPVDFSEMPWSNFMKPCRNIICHVKLCLLGLIFSKWLPLPWKRPKC